jgi:molybdenum cofactor biosynthesis enzyme MoaA
MTDCYHVTILSNLIRGYDKYARCYSKTGIPESTFPDQFFVLDRNELEIGIHKASRLLSKTRLPGDRLVVLGTRVAPHDLQENRRTGKGRVLSRGSIDVQSIFLLDDVQSLQPIAVEEACALSLACHRPRERHYDELRPRTVSILPVARGCQARCEFCFSEASASAETRGHALAMDRIEHVLAEGRRRGAERAVITGGGEPGLLPDDRLESLVRAASRHFPKVVLITNGYSWARRSENDRLAALTRLQEAGLSVLAISRHHHDRVRNAEIMRLDTASEAVAHTWATHRSELRKLKLRWICVLQKGAIEDRASLGEYVDWAAETGVEEICFKELYVSTTSESVYHAAASNAWSRDHQAPLRVVLDLAYERSWSRTGELPWGAPIFEGDVAGQKMRVAAYTEPSVFWELHNGVCRSWNLMADGRCLASLEDRKSEVEVA